jgi:hypothetical protein
VSEFFDRHAGTDKLRAACLAETLIDLYDLVHVQRAIAPEPVTLIHWARIRGQVMNSTRKTFGRVKTLLAENGVRLDLDWTRASHDFGVIRFDAKALGAFVAREIDEATERLEDYRSERGMRGPERVRPPREHKYGGEGEVNDDDTDEATEVGGNETDETNKEAIVTDEKTDATKSYGCETCGYTTTTGQGLSSHTRKHLNEAKREKAATTAPADPFSALRAALDAMPAEARRPALELLLALEAS